MKTAESNKADVASVFASCIALALLGLGCGGGKSMSDSSSNPPTSTTATIVAVLAAPGPPASLVVDGQVLAQNLSYMTSSNPLIVSSGPHQVLLQWPTRSVCNPQSLDLQPASRTTILCIF